jgi:hypothetical protein
MKGASRDENNRSSVSGRALRRSMSGAQLAAASPMFHTQVELATMNPMNVVLSANESLPGQPTTGVQVASPSLPSAQSRPTQGASDGKLAHLAMYGGAAAMKAKQLGIVSGTKQPRGAEETSIDVNGAVEADGCDSEDAPDGHFGPRSNGKGRVGRQMSFRPSKVTTRKTGR